MKVKTNSVDSSRLKFTGEGRKFSGYASVFGGVDSCGDTIIPGAYAKTLQGRARPIQMRWNHHGPVIGKWLDIKEDDVGLFVEGELTGGHSVAEDVYALMKHGAIDGMSIGYIPVNERKREDGVNELHEIELVEISPVESPADLGARISDVKSAAESAESLKEIEAILRDAGGFSRAGATALVSRIKHIITRGDREEKASELLEYIRQQTKQITARN